MTTMTHMRMMRGIAIMGAYSLCRVVLVPGLVGKLGRIGHQFPNELLHAHAAVTGDARKEGWRRDASRLRTGAFSTGRISAVGGGGAAGAVWRVAALLAIVFSPAGSMDSMPPACVGVFCASFVSGQRLPVTTLPEWFSIQMPANAPGAERELS